ncbi:hypothetical protein [Candidatus Frankia alpina]|nr:hypothetical protein [Candidatus Frankia alpina]
MPSENVPTPARAQSTADLAGHDGWLMLGTGWPTLPDACAATGMS